MCARDDKLRKAIETAVAAHSGRAPLACEEIGSDAQAARKRIALWEQADSVHCSIVGTSRNDKHRHRSPSRADEL